MMTDVGRSPDGSGHSAEPEPISVVSAKTASVPNALADIAAERQRQIDAEGWTPEHDDAHANGDLARAAACYAVGEQLFASRSYQKAEWRDRVWPWTPGWWKPKDRRADLVRAGALIVAEIERLDRAHPQSDTPL